MNRVDAVLERRRMTRGQLAEAIGLSKDKLSKSMSGARHFTVSEIAAIGERLGLDLYWLIQGRVDPLGAKVAYRHVYDVEEGQHLPPEDDERADLELVQRAYSLAEVPANDEFEIFRDEVGAVEDPTWEQLRACADQAGKRWAAWADAHGTRLDVEGFLVSIGIDLIVLPSPMGQRAHTYSLELRGRKVIVVHTTRAWYSALFGVFHELAHLLFGHLEWRTGEQRDWTIAQEPAANAFAANLLLPAPTVRALTPDAPTAALAELCWQHQIGAATLKNRCEQLRLQVECPTQVQLADDWGRNHSAAAEARSSEWQAARFPAWLIERHEQLVGDGVIPADTLAEMTDTPVEDLAPRRAPDVTDDVAAAMAELGL